MQKKGCLKVPRGLIDACRGNEERGAAVHLLSMAETDAASVSLRSLAREWGWTTTSTFRFLQRINGHGLTINSNGGKTIITLGTPSGTPSGTLNSLKNKAPVDVGGTPSGTPSGTLNILNDMQGFAALYGDGFSFSFVAPSMARPFLQWLTYKAKEQNFRYKTQTSLEICYRDFERKAGGDPDTARAIVEQSIGNGWKGLFKLKENGYDKQPECNAAFARQAAAAIRQVGLDRKMGQHDTDEPPF